MGEENKGYGKDELLAVGCRPSGHWWRPGGNGNNH